MLAASCNVTLCNSSAARQVAHSLHPEMGPELFQALEAGQYMQDDPTALALMLFQRVAPTLKTPGSSQIPCTHVSLGQPSWQPHAPEPTLNGAVSLMQHHTRTSRMEHGM